MIKLLDDMERMKIEIERSRLKLIWRMKCDLGSFLLNYLWFRDVELF